MFQITSSNTGTELFNDDCGDDQDPPINCTSPWKKERYDTITDINELKVSCYCKEKRRTSYIPI